ncbi:hypothetical protein B0H19DRAFT_578358 [Mycena capillaripes]|nr:hypothetical protein B0H19DRAFT_578358 [Mycena capillaripes]
MPYSYPMPLGSRFPLDLLFATWIPYIGLAFTSPTKRSPNITISVPDGTTTHGDPHILCIPASALDILVFFAANYFAHAITVKGYPGESGTAKYLSYLAALFFPASGLVRGLTAIARRGRFVKGPLERAVRSGALCMVVRNEQWEPDHGQQMTDIRVKSRSKQRVPLLSFRVVLWQWYLWFYPPLYLMRVINRVVIRLLMRYKPGLASRLHQVDTAIYNLFMSSDPLYHFLQSHLPEALARPLARTTFADDELDTLTPSEMQNRYTVLTTYVPQWAKESSKLWSFQDTIELYVNPKSRKIHGVHRLPPGYSFAHVPRDAKVAPLVRDVDLVLRPQSGAPTAVAALVQGFYSAFTLYTTQGGQVATYGYAAFGLTVLPYTIMTLFNLLGNRDARLFHNLRCRV